MESVKTITYSESCDLSKLLEQPQTPLLIKGLAANWPLTRSGSENANGFKDYLLSFHQDMTVGMGTIPAADKGRLFYNDSFSGFNFDRQNVPFNHFLDILLSASEVGDCHYMGSTNVDKLFPGIRDFNDVTALKEKHPLVSIWMSNRAKVAAHQDLPDNLAICVAGKRRFTLFPPNQVGNLYVGPVDFTPAGQAISLVDHSDPDFDIYPKYQQALKHGLVAELEPGDGLILPSLWWHAVEGLDTVNVLVNYWWQQGRPGIGSPMDALLHSIMNISQMPEHKKAAMAELFNFYVFGQEEHQHIPNKARGILSPTDEMAVRKIRSLLLNKLNQ